MNNYRLYRKLVEIRTLLDENTPKGKQSLSNFIKKIEEVIIGSGKTKEDFKEEKNET